MAVSPAEIIRRRRAQLGLSQEQLAERIGRAASTVRRWEKGEAVPPDGVISALATALQVAPRDLAVAFGESGDEESETTPDPTTAAPAAPRTAAPPPAPSGRATEPPIDEQATVAAATAVAASAVAKAPVAAPPQQPKRRSPLWRAPALDPSEGLSYLEDSRQRFRYWLRAALTIVAIIILLMLLMWAFGEFWDALGKVWDLFGDDAPPVTAPGTDF